MVRSPAELFDRFHLALYRYLVRMTGRPDVAEDLTQDVFVRLLRSGAPDLPEGERGWLFSIARNLLIDWQRRNLRNPVQSAADGDNATVGAQQVLAFDVREALLALPQADREAFLLRVIGGLGHEEIAALTGATPASIRSRIFRARSALRSALGSAASASPSDKPNASL
jgi:RNA polymerase sigma factor (sigma-70 family)